MLICSCRTISAFEKYRHTAHIALEVRESNAPAIAIYEKNGFESVGIRKNFYSDPKENGIVMIRRIERDQDEC